MSRWVGFFIAILVGIGLGLLYGWVLSPIEYVNTTPDTLRMDYKTDYVLMVAEAFKSDQDMVIALRRLALLGDVSPAEMTRQAILFAQRVGYTDIDLKTMQALSDAIDLTLPVLGTPAP